MCPQQSKGPRQTYHLNCRRARQILPWRSARRPHTAYHATKLFHLAGDSTAEGPHGPRPEIDGVHLSQLAKMVCMNCRRACGAQSIQLPCCNTAARAWGFQRATRARASPPRLRNHHIGHARLPFSRDPTLACHPLTIESCTVTTRRTPGSPSAEEHDAQSLAWQQPLVLQPPIHHAADHTAALESRSPRHSTADRPSPLRMHHACFSSQK